MDQILSLRPFVPARDHDQSKRFYETLGFRVSLEEKDFAENTMIQLLVRDADAWWTRIDADALVAAFALKPPRPPAVQPWGLKVGFVFDPSGVLWHIAESPF